MTATGLIGIIIIGIIVLVAVNLMVYGKNRDTDTEGSDITILTEYEEGTRVLGSLCYRLDEEDTNCYLDVAFQSTGEAKPLILCVHGGSWYQGTRGEFDSFMYTFSANGYVVATIEYNLYPEVSIMDEVDCVADAVAYLAEHAADYEIDADRIVIVGYSAGAQLALRYAEEYADHAANYDFTLCAAIDIFGPMDLEYMIYNVDIAEMAFLIENPDAIDGVEDSYIITEMKKMDVVSNLTDQLMPILIIQGTDDDMVPITVSNRFYEALTALGIETQYEVVAGMGHDTGNSAIIPLCDAFLSAFFQQ